MGWGFGVGLDLATRLAEIGVDGELGGGGCGE